MFYWEIGNVNKNMMEILEIKIYLNNDSHVEI